jgi:Ca2+-binding RTX toxin-like protein
LVHPRLDVADGVDLRIATQENLDMALPTIGGNFQFAANGAEDQIYGFSYSSMKPAAHESSITDAFLITSIPTGSLFYNAGSLAAPHYFQISGLQSNPNAAGALELRITGVFVNGAKVSGSDGNLYWSSAVDTTVTGGNGGSAFTPGVGAGAGAIGIVNAVTVNAVDNVDGIFQNTGAGLDVVATDGTVSASLGSYGNVNLLAPPPLQPTVVLDNDTTNGGAGYNIDKITSDPTLTVTNVANQSAVYYNLDSGGWGAANIYTPPATDGTAEGAHSVQVKEINPQALTGPITTFNFTLDTIAPVAPTVTVNDSTDGGGGHAADGVTNVATPNVAGEAGAVNMYSVDGNAFALTVGLALDGSADGVHDVTAYQIDIANNSNPANFNAAVNFTLDTQADGFDGTTATVDATAAIVTIGTTIIGPGNINSVAYTIDGLDADANAVMTFTSDGGGTVSYTLDSTQNTVGDIADLTGFSTGTVTVTMDITDYANNLATGTAQNTATLTIPPTPEYQAVVYDATNETLTITGNNFASILVGGGTMGDLTGRDIYDNGQLNLGDANYDLGYGYTGNLNGDVASAFVVDDHTLVLHLNGNEAFYPGNAEAGMTGYSQQMDTLAFSTSFATDTAGYAFPDAAGAMGIMGSGNEPIMPQTYTIDMAGDGTLFSETMGANAPLNVATTDVNGNYGYGSVTVSGVSAAQVDLSGSVSYDGGNGTDILIVASNHFDGLTSADSNSFTVHGYDQYSGWWFDDPTLGNLDSTNNNGNPMVTFADGSELITNVFGRSTLTGGNGDDQLIAGNSGDRLAGNSGNDLLIGGSGNDQIYGGSGDDIIYGGGGSNYLSGGTGRDIFVIGTADGAHNTISDFSVADEDVLNIFGVANPLALAVQSGNDTLIVLGANDTIRLLGVSAASLTADNFDTVDQFNYNNGGTVS